MYIFVCAQYNLIMKINIVQFSLINIIYRIVGKNVEKINTHDPAHVNKYQQDTIYYINILFY